MVAFFHHFSVRLCYQYNITIYCKTSYSSERGVATCLFTSLQTLLKLKGCSCFHSLQHNHTTRVGNEPKGAFREHGSAFFPPLCSTFAAGTKIQLVHWDRSRSATKKALRKPLNARGEQTKLMFQVSCWPWSSINHLTQWLGTGRA